MISRADWVLLAVSFTWAATFVVVKDALSGVSTFLFLAIRFTLAAAALALVVRGRLSLNGAGLRSQWRGALTCGLFLFAGMALQTQGLRFTTASRSAFLTGLYIVLVPLLSSFVHQGRPRPVEFIGALLAGGGTALLAAGGSGWAQQSWAWNPGDVLTVLGAFAFSGHILAVAHYSRSMQFENLALYQIGGVALFSWLAVWPMEQPRIEWSASMAWSILATAILATTLAFLFYTWAQKRTTAARAALIFATEPVFAGLIAWRWAGEGWTVRALAGAGLILSGIVLVEVKPRNRQIHQIDKGMWTNSE